MLHAQEAQSTPCVYFIGGMLLKHVNWETLRVVVQDFLAGFFDGFTLGAANYPRAQQCHIVILFGTSYLACWW